MTGRRGADPLFGAAVLLLTFELRGMADDPGFRAVFRGTLRDLGLDDAAVRAYVEAHREELERHVRSGGRG